MPRTRGLIPIQKVEYQREVLADRCSLILFKNKISKSAVARYLDISPQTVAKQFERKHLTMQVFMAVATLTNMSPSELEDMVKVR